MYASEASDGTKDGQNIIDSMSAGGKHNQVQKKPIIIEGKHFYTSVFGNKINPMA